MFELVKRQLLDLVALGSLVSQLDNIKKEKVIVRALKMKSLNVRT